MLGLFKFLCFKYNLIHYRCQMFKMATLPWSAFSRAGSSQLLQSIPFWGGETEQTWLSWHCSSCGWNCQPLFIAHIGRSCSMACAPTSQSFGAVWAVQVSAAPAGSSCAPVLKSFITPLTVCVEFNFCWRTKLQYLPINCHDFALRIFVVDKCCLKYQNI